MKLKLKKQEPFFYNYKLNHKQLKLLVKLLLKPKLEHKPKQSKEKPTSKWLN
jgi:hypothetical protein